MPSSRYQTSRLTGQSVPQFYLHADSRHLKDTAGRTIILRGVNLCASAKVPRGHPQHILDDFWESAEQDGFDPESSKQKDSSINLSESSFSSSNSLYTKPPAQHGISYVGQTLDLEDGSADVHLTRLRQWGFNCVRFVTVWEALEHQGPGQYDVEYMDYVVSMLRKCKQYGFRVYMDPHQDLFSRFCGGSGAPLWTLYACGLNPRNFTVTGAAFLQAEWPHPDRPDPESVPAMIWATNYTRLACQTVNTMFWAGRDYAPKCIIDGINIQDYLQYHFLEAYRRLAMKIADAGDLLDDTVIGWDSLNEPNHGYLGLKNIIAIPDEVPLQIGPTPTAIQGMKLGMGQPAKLENYRFGPLGPQRDGTVLIDPEGKKAWLHESVEPNGVSGYGWKRDPGWALGTCIWAQHGVWDPFHGTVLKPDYFAFSPSNPTKKADFAADHWRPHLNAYCHMIRQIHREAILFVHPPVFEVPPDLRPDVLPILQHRSVFSSHFYDGLTLVTKHWNWFNADALGILRGKYPSVVFGLKIGETAIRKCMRAQLAMLKQDGLDKMGEFPMMMGEIGIPYDLDKRRAYKDGDYSNQVKAMDASLNACDGENMINYTIWTYCPSNSHRWGDLWNGEDLSLWSRDDAKFQDSGYSEKSSRFGKVLARPSQYNYGSRSQGPTPNASDITLAGGGPFSDSESRYLNSCEPTADMRLDLDPSLCLNYNNLNDGARALAAFCRPFPVVTVGVPLHFNFDIGTAAFEMTVEVGGDEDVNEVEDDDLPTEIYVPAAHFGALAPAQAQASLTRRSKSENNLSHLGDWNDYSDSSLSLQMPKTNDMGTVSSYRDILQLEVTVSIGRWETVGQTLKWYYPRKPPPGKTGKYTIRVKRKAGPILRDLDQTMWSKMMQSIGAFFIILRTWFWFKHPKAA